MTMQAIITKYLAPTNTRGARIKVISSWGNKTYSFGYEAHCPWRAAFNQWLAEKNAEMAEKYPDVSGDWFKFVEVGNSPDGSGYIFLIK